MASEINPFHNFLNSESLKTVATLRYNEMSRLHDEHNALLC